MKEQNNPNTDVNNAMKEKDIVVYNKWSAPGRTFKKRGKEYFVNLGVLVFFISLIFLFFKEFIVIITIWVLFGIFYIFSTVEPEQVTHRITSSGVDFAGFEYKWRDLSSFFFSKKNGANVLNLNTVKPLPGRIYLILNSDTDLDKLYDILKEHISFIEKPINNWFDKLIESLSDKFSLE